MKDFDSNTPIATLIERFEKDMRFDAHSTRAKVSRSEASKQLELRDLDALVPIGVFLRTFEIKNPIDASVKEGFALLLSWIGRKHPALPPPQGIENFDEKWSAWAINWANTHEPAGATV